MNTAHSISRILKKSLCASQAIFDAYQKRIKEGSLTRDDDSESHFCVYFLPQNPKNKEIFIVDHKKAGLWLSPGGHIDKGETVFKALSREIFEELGLKNFFKKEPEPFLFTITPINKPRHTLHYDIWYLMLTDGHDFKIDFTEFNNVKWLSINEARKIITDAPNLEALSVVEKM